MLQIEKANTYQDVVNGTVGWTEGIFHSAIKRLIELVPTLEENGYALPIVRSTIQMVAARRAEMFPPPPQDTHF